MNASPPPKPDTAKPASALPPDRLRAMARAHYEVRRKQGYGYFCWDDLQPEHQAEYLAAAQACWEASPGGELMEALREAEYVLERAADVPREDPEHGPEVEALGQRIGFGALMTSASASWRKIAPMEGAEFTCSPCRITALRALQALRQALPQADVQP